MSNKIRVTNHKVLVLYSFDEVNKLYTLSTLERGGPLVVDSDFETAKKKMAEQLIVVSSLGKLMFYDKYRTNEDRKTSLANSLGKVIEETYLELVA